MRRNKIAWLLVPALLLAGCGKTAPADAQPTATTETAAAQTETPEAAAPGFANVGTLIQYPYTCGGYWGWNTGDAYYEIAQLPARNREMMALILKTDYATGKQAPLCNVPNCTHDSTACPAYLESWSRTNLLVLNGEVYVYYAGTDYWNGMAANETWEEAEELCRNAYPEYADEYPDEEEYLEVCRREYEREHSPSSLEKFNADLTARTTVWTFTQDMRDLEELSFAYCDENALYGWTGSSYDNTAGEIVRLDLATGGTQTIPLHNAEVVCGVQGNRFLTCRTVTDAPLPEQQGGEIYEEMLDNAISEYDWLDPCTLEREKICEMPYRGSDFLGLHKNRLYVMDNYWSDDSGWSHYSFAYYGQDGQRTELISDLPINFSFEHTDSGFMPAFSGQERGWLWGDEWGTHSYETINYRVDLDTGEMTKITQMQYRDGIYSVVSLMAQTNDGRWMIGYKPHSDTHNDRCDYGFISPQDFLNGSENYTPVEMWE